MFLEWNWSEAEKSLDRAVELDSNSVEAHHWRGVYLAIRGRFTEAQAELNRALELDPTSANMISDLGQIHYFSSNFASAERFYLRANMIHENIADPRLIDLYEIQGRTQEAFELQSANECRPFNGIAKSNCLENLEDLFRIGDSKEIARRYIDLFNRRLADNNLPKDQIANAWYGLATQHKRLGNRQKAIESLKKTLENKTRFEIINFTFPFVAVDPQFDELRREPKFQRILREANL